jgi:membrane protease YdiL (CAAX protease family)
MTTIKAFIKRHSVLTYFILTFVISWGGVLILGAPYGMPTTSEQFEKLWPIVFLPYFLGPSISSILLISVIYGKVGIRELLSQLFRWRVGTPWYAVALLTAPLLVTIVLLPLSLTSPVFLPGIITTADKFGLILSGILVGLIFGGLLEELGWTGFSVPELRRHYGVLTTGIIVGFLWGVWHFLPTYWGSGDSSGSLSLSQLLPPCLFYVAVLPAYRVLMVWVYDRTGKSLLVLMLMHMSLTASTLFILAPSASGVSLMIYYLILAALMWVIVVVMAKVKGGQFSRQPLQKRVSQKG